MTVAEDARDGAVLIQGSYSRNGLLLLVVSSLVG
jgi:hypothetical protein